MCYHTFTDLILTISTEGCTITVPYSDSIPVKEICAQKIMSTKITTHRVE